MNNCAKCEQSLAPYICDLPQKWQEAIIRAVCISISTPLTCDDVKGCETLTDISAITSTGESISMTFTDEDHKRYFLEMDISTLVDTSLEGLDPGCLASQEDWDALSNTERLQLIINSSCNC